jgi:hypothetical protein
MKTFLLFFAATITLISAKAQFTQNFEGTESALTGNCWTLLDVHQITDPADVITGTGSMYTNPPTSGSGTRDILSPALNITSTSFTVSFNYKVSSKINGNATRTIEIGLLDVTGNFTSLYTITMDKNSPTTVQSFNQTFTLASSGVRKLVLRLGGATGDGNSRLIFDDIYASANPLYGSNTCNSSPVAVDDAFAGPIGSVIIGNVLANDSDPDGEAIKSFIVITSADGTVVVNQNGDFTFTPNPGFSGSSTTFTYNLLDAGFDPLTSNTATVTINFFANSLLPVKLLNFDAKYNKPNVTLSWSTVMEKNFSHFEIEYSTDGSNFNQAAIIFGTGESDSKKDYTYVDKNVAGRSGLVYYRLKSVDIDGKASYSSIRIIRLSEERQGMVLIAYPNPVSSELRVTIPANWQNKEVVFEVFNQNGQKVKTSRNGNAGQTENIVVSNLAKGFYLIKANCGLETAQQKIIKN